MTHASELTSCSWRPDDRAVAFYASSNSIRSSPRVGARCGLPLQAKGPVQGAVVVPLRAHFPNKGPAESSESGGPTQYRRRLRFHRTASTTSQSARPDMISSTAESRDIPAAYGSSSHSAESFRPSPRLICGAFRKSLAANFRVRSCCLRQGVRVRAEAVVLDRIAAVAHSH